MVSPIDGLYSTIPDSIYLLFSLMTFASSAPQEKQYFDQLFTVVDKDNVGPASTALLMTLKPCRLASSLVKMRFPSSSHPVSLNRHLAKSGL